MIYYQKHVVNFGFLKNLIYNFKDDTLHSEGIFVEFSGKLVTTLCKEGVRILKCKVSEFFENGQKKCLFPKTLDILWESRDL